MRLIQADFSKPGGENALGNNRDVILAMVEQEGQILKAGVNQGIFRPVDAHVQLAVRIGMYCNVLSFTELLPDKGDPVDTAIDSTLRLLRPDN